MTTQTDTRDWKTSTYSDPHADDPSCVEVALDPASVRVRDTKDHGQGLLTAGPAAWTAFVTAVKG